MQRYPPPKVDLMLDKNRKFYWQVAQERIIISGDRLKHHMKIINGKHEDNDFVMNSMEQTIKIFVRSCDNENNEQGDIKYDIKIFSK